MKEEIIIDNNLYFRYYKINCYLSKGFEAFINLIKTNQIKITLMLRVVKSGIDIGKNKNKNMVFLINKFNLDSLYNEIYFYEN